MPDAGETNKYALELGEIVRKGDFSTFGSRKAQLLAALMLHHDLKLLTDALTGRRCACGALDSPNHRYMCHVGGAGLNAR